MKFNCAICGHEFQVHACTAPDRIYGICGNCGLEHTMVKKVLFREGDRVKLLQDYQKNERGDLGTVTGVAWEDSQYYRGTSVTVKFDKPKDTIRYDRSMPDIILKKED